jgi:hypothetical protein
MSLISFDTFGGSANSTLKWRLCSDGLVIVHYFYKWQRCGSKPSILFRAQHYNKIHRIVKLLHVSILQADRQQICKLWDLIIQQNNGKAVPVTGLDRPWKLQEDKTHRFHDNRNMNVVRLSALRTDRLYSPGNIPGIHFCYRLGRPHGHSSAGRIISVKNSNDPTGNRTRDY